MNVNFTQAAKLAGVSRGTLYARIKNGTISASTDRQGNRVIETSELIRVFGALKPLTPSERQGDVGLNVITQGADTQIERTERALITALQETIAILKSQLEDAKEREAGLMGLLQQRLLPGPSDNGSGKSGKRQGKKKR